MKTEGWLFVTLHYARCEHICRPYVTAPQGLMLSTLGHCARLWGHRTCTKVLLAKIHFLVCEQSGYVTIRFTPARTGGRSICKWVMESSLQRSWNDGPQGKTDLEQYWKDSSGHLGPWCVCTMQSKDHQKAKIQRSSQWYVKRGLTLKHKETPAFITWRNHNGCASGKRLCWLWLVCSSETSLRGQWDSLMDKSPCFGILMIWVQWLHLA